MPRRTLAILAFAAPLLSPHAIAQETDDGLETAIFAGGCFWCVEADFDKLPGVEATISGYIGGTTENPSYREVVAGGTGHYEAVEIRYDPEVIDYETLVYAFFRSVDPTDAGGQFCDRGESYRTAIFATDPEQRRIAEAEKKQAAETIDAEIVTPILDAGAFWTAEDYHQNYYKTNSLKYQYYRYACGRDGVVEDIWGADVEESFKALSDRLG